MIFVLQPGLQDDVSKFLNGLKTGKEPRSKSQYDRKNKPDEPALSKEKPTKKKGRKNNNATKEDVPAENVFPVAPAVTGVKPTKGQSRLAFEPSAQWYEAMAALPPAQNAAATPSSSQITSLFTRATNLFDADAAAYQTSSAFTGKSASDTHFLNTILSKGTLSDRLSALTLLVQASPVHNTKALETLKGMAERGRGKGGREEGLKAMRCVVDWWVGGGAPSRKLRYFRDQPLLHPSVTDQHLIAWYFEDWLKKYFFAILQILEVCGTPSTTPRLIF